MFAALVLLVLTAAGTAHAQGDETNARDWLRAGDLLAGAGDTASLERALAAYAHVLERPADPDYAQALQRVAWALFLLDRTPEAIARFAQLVERLDASGAPQPALRREAIELLGAMFADPDWDRDGVPDAEGALARLADPGLLAQDRPWLRELYLETAHALYLTLRDPEAIALLDHALTRWPVQFDRALMEAACRRHRARQEAMEEQLGTLPATDALCARHAPPSS